MKDERRYWLDEKKSVDKIVYALYAACTLLVVADFFYHKRVHLEIERWIGFYGWYGFVACVLIVLAAKVLRVLLKRDEDYYDR